MSNDMNSLPVLEPAPRPLAAAPYAHDKSSISRIMWTVCFALTPMTLYGFYLFGWPALNLFLVTCLSAVLTESLCCYWLKKKQAALLDGSAFLTGWLLALSLPPWAPWWIGVGGAVFAIGIGKQLYGGIGQNIFNPAMLARCALLISFPLQMTTWPIADVGQTFDFYQSLQVTFSGIIPDGTTGPTNLGNLKTALSMKQDVSQVLAEDFQMQSAFFGQVGGSLGETSELLILLGALWLLIKRIISWEIPLSMLFGVVLPTLIAHEVNPERYADISFHLTTGGLLLGAFFIATDPVTSPGSKPARLIFGFGCGLMTWIVRTWGGFPEAVAFSVLFMNAWTPLLDKYVRPRVYGRQATGKPIRAKKPTAAITRSEEK